MGLESLVIREASQGDAETLRWIEANDGFPYPYKKTAEDFARYIEEGTKFYIAEHEGMPVGHISLADCEYLSGDRLHFLAVIKSYQGKSKEWEGGGVGPRLMAHFEEQVKKRGKDCAVINVYENNPRAIRFYEKLGYERWFIIPHRYEDGINAVVMRKDFTAKYPHRKAAREMSAGGAPVRPQM
ncbi:MAG: GNAT family N-acetyltransferase [DPANN group archaeon]|nr:GNAT family N-acetyltransferase [DPANN group archaeon]